MCVKHCKYQYFCRKHRFWGGGHHIYIYIHQHLEFVAMRYACIAKIISIAHFLGWQHCLQTFFSVVCWLNITFICEYIFYYMLTPRPSKTWGLGNNLVYLICNLQQIYRIYIIILSITVISHNRNQNRLTYVHHPSMLVSPTSGRLKTRQLERTNTHQACSFTWVFTLLAGTTGFEDICSTRQNLGPRD